MRQGSVGSGDRGASSAEGVVVSGGQPASNVSFGGAVSGKQAATIAAMPGAMSRRHTVVVSEGGNKNGRDGREVFRVQLSLVFYHSPRLAGWA